MILHIFWGLLCASIQILAAAQDDTGTRLRGSDLQKIEIELDFLDNDALVIYNDARKSKAKISYAQKKKIVAYRDELNGYCLLQRIRKHERPADIEDEVNEDRYSRLYRASGIPMSKIEVGNLAGKKIAVFCEKYTTILLEEYSKRSGKSRVHRNKRTKREVYSAMRGNESDISHQEISKKLLEELVNADNLLSNAYQSGKSHKRNVDGGTDNGGGHYPSASAKIGDGTGVDYQARIRNNLNPAAHGSHPIDVTSSVTIATGSSHPGWSYPPSASSRYAPSVPMQNATTNGHPAGARTPGLHGTPQYLPSGRQNVSQSPESAHRGPSSHVHHVYVYHTPGPMHPGMFPYPSSSGQGFKNGGPHSLGKSQNVTGGSHHPSGEVGHYGPSSSARVPYSHGHGQGHHPAYLPPSSSSTNYQYLPHHDNASHPHTQTPYSNGRGFAYAPQFPPSSVSKLNYLPNIAGYVATQTVHPGARNVSAAHLPPSSAGEVHHGPPSGSQGGLHDHGKSAHPAPEYRPSGGGKLYTPIAHGTPRFEPSARSGGIPSHFPPSSSSKVSPPSGSGERVATPGQNTMYERPSGKGSVHETGSYPPSSVGKSHYTPGSLQRPSAGGNLQGVSYYPPSSSSKTHYAPYGAGRDASFGPFAGSNLHSPSLYPPSSSSKIHYSNVYTDHSGKPSQQPISQSASSTGQSHQAPVHHQPSQIAQPSSAHFPPSAMSKSQSPSPYHQGGLSHQLPGGQYPPSASSVSHDISAQRSRGQQQHHHQVAQQQHHHQVTQQQHHPSSQPHHHPTAHQTHHPSGHQHPHQSAHQQHHQGAQQPHHPSGQDHQHQSGHHHHQQSGVGQSGHQPAAYYPPSSMSKLHQTHNGQQNFSGPSSGYYGPSSTSKQHSPVGVNANANQPHQSQPSLYVSSSVSLTPGQASYYPPSSFAKQSYNHNRPAVAYPQSGHYPAAVQPSYYGPSSTSHHLQNDSSIGQTVPSSVSHALPSSGHYPPSSSGKVQPGLQTNGTGVDSGRTSQHDSHGKASYPTAQHPSASGGDHHPGHPGRANASAAQYPYGSGRAESQHPSTIQGAYHPQFGGGYAAGYPPQYPLSSSSSPTSYNGVRQRQGDQSPQFSSPGAQSPCQGSPRSLYSITTRTILTPNGVIQRPVSIKTNGNSPCSAASLPAATPYNNRLSPCSGPGQNGQGRTQVPCSANRANRQSRNTERGAIVPGPAVLPVKRPDMHAMQLTTQANSGVDESQAELLGGAPYPFADATSQFSKLQTEKDNSTLKFGEKEDASAPEFLDENGQIERDVEMLESDDSSYERTRARPLKYVEDKAEKSLSQEIEPEEGADTKEEEPEEIVKEGDILQPGDRILGKDGYTVSEGFRARVVSVTGQVGKKRAESSKDSPPTKSQSLTKTSSFAKFRYSSELGRYVKDERAENFSNCHGELSFTCTEFFGSNGRAKICKPNPRRNPDGTPCQISS